MIKVTIRATETKVSERHFMVDPEKFERFSGGVSIESALHTPAIFELVLNQQDVEERVVNQVGHSNYEDHDEEAYIKEGEEHDESFARMVAEDQRRAAMRIAGDHESDN